MYFCVVMGRVGVDATPDALVHSACTTTGPGYKELETQISEFRGKFRAFVMAPKVDNS